MAGAVAGVWLSGVPEIARRILPFSGIVLLALSLFWVLPEVAGKFGWNAGATLMFAAFAAVWFIDRFIYPVCPACSHTHDHDACSTRLHGFAAPLITAALVHSLFDGWTMAVGAGNSIALTVLVHKIPESLAYGVILRAALRSRRNAVVWALVAQGATALGAVLGSAAAPLLSDKFLGALLALGGGTFLYLGFHAVHGEWKRRLSERTVRI